MSNKNILPVGIFAHNEEKNIKFLLDSIINQNLSIDSKLRVFVLANACDDHTETVVRRIKSDNPAIRIISIRKKGKPYSLETFKKLLSRLIKKDYTFDKVILMDADIEFPEVDILANLSKMLDKNPEIYAVVANPIPESVFNNKKDIISTLYRAKFKFQEYYRIRSFSGMCYSIRWEVLKGICIPGFIMAEDRFLAEKLKKRFVRSREISIKYKIVKSVLKEVKRNLRHCIANRQIERMYGSEVLKPISSSRSNVINLKDERSGMGFMMVFLRLSFAEKISISVFGLISMLNNIRAYFLLRNIKQDSLINKYWITTRE